jgi:class 3 adenylate cyclase/predicted ATPase/biotin operon repressor
MEFNVLGPLTAIGNEGRRVVMPSVAQRRLLSMLLLRSGTVVSADYLADHLELSTGALRTSVSRLRRIVGFDTLVTAPPGYELRSPNIDVKAFERLLDEARSTADGADGADRRSLLASAIGLWRGVAFAEFSGESWAITEVTRLTELRSGAIEDLCALGIEEGNSAKAISQLEELISSEPFRDRPRLLLMRALHESGRTRDALRAFQTYRRFLQDEVGVEPSAAVTALDRSIAQEQNSQVASTTVVAGLRERGSPDAVKERTANTDQYSDTEKSVRNLPQAQNPKEIASAAALPTGVVTFLFTDIEGSTRKWNDHPILMNEALARHHTLLTETIRAHTGTVFASGGDGFAAAFVDPGRAAAAAITIQESLSKEPWPAPLEIAVRMGIHTGMSFERDGDYFGPTLNATARLMSVANGGQVLLSAATKAILRDDLLPGGVAIFSHGRHSLADIAEPMEVFEIRGDNLPGSGRTIRSSPVVLAKLPIERSTLVGRAQELETIGAALKEHRLVSLVGPGGCGKSVVALRAAHRCSPDFPHGVFHVDLSSLDDASLLSSTVARGLDLPADRFGSVEALALDLSGRSFLLVLDNVEHLSDAVADFADLILDRDGPNLVVTSRVRLDVMGERVVQIGGLSQLDVDGISDGAHLFLERAIEAGQVVDGSPASVSEIEELCRCLDYLPLAIELAASNALGISPHQLALEINRGVVLASGRRSRRRFATVEEMVEWSIGILDPVAQSLLRGFSPFRGNAPAEAIHQVWSPDARVADFSVALSSLVRMNLVIVDTTDELHTAFDDRSLPSTLSYRCLETVRRVAIEKAKEALEFDELRQRHRDWYLAWSEAGSGIEQLYGSRRALRDEAQIGNFRAALSYSAENNEGTSFVRQVVALTSMWCFFGKAAEGLRWLRSAPPHDAKSIDPIRLSSSAMRMAFSAIDWKTFADYSVAVPEAVGTRTDDIARVALGFYGISLIAEPNRGLTLLDEALTRGQGQGDPLCDLMIENCAGELLLLNHRYEESLTRFENAVQIPQAEGGDPLWSSAAMANRALAQILCGDFAGGVAEALRSTEPTVPLLAIQVASRSAVVHALGLGELGETGEAARLLSDCLESMCALTKIPELFTEPLGGVAYLFAISGNTSMASKLVNFMSSTGFDHRSPWQRVICRVAIQRLSPSHSIEDAPTNARRTRPPKQIGADEIVTHARQALQQLIASSSRS